MKRLLQKWKLILVLVVFAMIFTGVISLIISGDKPDGSSPTAPTKLGEESATENSALPLPIPTPTPTTKAVKMVGYYAAWAAYLGYTPDKIDASKLTHINYAFANIGSDLKIELGYPDVDTSNFSKLNTLKQAHPGLKTLISVGGWAWSGKFSDMALTEASRTTFADSCVDFIVKYGFNGVDIDWEYPVSGGMSTNIKRPEDKHNFTLLLKKLREKLNARSLLDGKQYLLTIAGADGRGYANNTELGIVQQYLDYANIMTYDINGTWGGYTDFNAPLYNNSDISPQNKWSADSSVNAWLKAGLPAEKLIVGVPFYGYKYNSVKNANNGLYQTFSGGSAISYANIATNFLKAPEYVRYFHQQSMVPWLFNGSTFISYEDEKSIGQKALYIKSKGLGGAAIWEISQDPNRILLGALYKGLK
ncbi:MAG TPA: glycoside hydrolase family 18 protein [Ruminiclostridium sp.]